MPVLNSRRSLLAALTLGAITSACGPEELRAPLVTQRSSLAYSSKWGMTSLMRNGSTNENDEWIDVVTTSAGNVVVGGYDNGKRGQSAVDPSGNARGIIFEYSYNSANSTFDYVQSKTINQNSSAETVEALALGPLPSEDVYFVGRTNGKVSSTPNAGQFDIYAGWWSRGPNTAVYAQFGDERPQHPLRLALDKAGDLVISGHNDTYVPTNYVEEWEDPFIVKLHKSGDSLSIAPGWPTPAGKPRWTSVQFNIAGSDFMPGMCVDKPATGDSSIYVTGVIGSGPDRGIFLRKYQASNGAQVWKTTPSNIALDMGAATLMTKDGQHLLFAGSTYKKLGAQQYGGQDVVVSSVNPATGAVEWSQQYGSSDEDWVTDMALDDEGNIYLVGETLGTVDSNVPNQGDYDVFVIKLDKNGENPKKFQIGSPLEDHPAAVAVDAHKNIYVVGYTAGSLQEGLANGGQRDAFILRLTAPSDGEVGAF